MSGLNKKIGVVGIGNAGGQVAFLCEKKYGDLMNSVYINSSDADLAMVGDSPFKFKIGQAELEGSGKNRTRTKKYLREDIRGILMDEDFQSLINGKKYVFVIASAAGGTGSGAAPVMLNILREAFLDVNFILVVILPQLQASIMEQGNAREFTDELYGLLGDCTYMAYDNETASDLGPTQALVSVNEAIVEDIRVISGVDNFPTPYESIDEADMESIVTTPGRLMVIRVIKNLSEKVLEDTSVDDILIKAIKTSRHAEINRDKKIVRCGMITYFTEQVNSLYGSNLSKLQEFIGTPLERFNHNAVNGNSEQMNFLYFIASGLSPINDRVKKMDERVDELKKALDASNVGDYVTSDENNSYDVMAERKRKEKLGDRAGQEFQVFDIFDKFQ